MRPDRGWLCLCFLLLFAFIAAYSMAVGPIVFWGDSYLFTDRSKHLFFEGNLNLNNHGSLIYPPLYSIVLAPVYALGDSARSAFGITILNAFFAASVLFPINALLRHYAELKATEARLFALLLSASPTLVIYAPMVLSEAFFAPIVYWTAYTVMRSLTSSERRWFISSGLMMAGGLLTRSAATSLFLGGLTAWTVGIVFAEKGRSWERMKLSLYAIVAFAVPMAAWYWFERFHVLYQGGVGYSVTATLRSLLANPADQLIKLHWVINAILYFLCAPLNLAGFLVLSLAARKINLLLRDPLFPFFVTVVILAIVSIVIVAPTSYGGEILTWNKYFAPFVGFATLLVLRLRTLLNRRDIFLGVLMILAATWLGRPSQLVCHFPDALTPLMDSTSALGVESWIRDALLGLGLVATVPLFLPGRPRSRIIGAVVAGSLSLISVTAAANYWQHVGSSNAGNYRGVGIELRVAQANSPSTPVLYDPAMVHTTSVDAFSLLFDYQGIAQSLPLSNLLLPDAAPSPPFFYATRTTFSGAKPIAKEESGLAVYHITTSLAGGALSYTLGYGQDVGGAEKVPMGDRQITVRWLGPSPHFVINVDRDIGAAEIGLRLSVGGEGRTAIAELNGQVLDGHPLISRVLWRDGFDYVRWTVSLKKGDNQFSLRSESPPVVLPDGQRKVTFLLVDEPTLSQQSSSSP